MSKLPWVMTQEWHDVYFLHWPIAPEDIRQYVPIELEIDTFEDQAWIGIIFFKMKNFRARLMPSIPSIDTFFELNVRTYVKHKGKSGVYFFSLDVNNKIVSQFAKFGRFLPFRFANMTSKIDQKVVTFQNRWEYTGKFPEVFIASVEVSSEPIQRTPLEYWLTERHHLWTKVVGRLIRQYNRHSPWILQRVHCTVHENSMSPFLMRNVKENKPIAHFSKYKKAFLYLPVKES
ncbi:YqjF family protein [Rummeliibacillus pycnus]|uniref:YqjF family protein n=1 Tax=Rummeliibacillus pycnus TaxID=101070 RepID=UPI0037C94639